MTEYTRDHLYVRRPTLPRPVRALPVMLFPADCPICFAPVPAVTCPQCGAHLHVQPCATDEAASFSVN